MKLYLRFWSLLFSSLDCLSWTLKHGPLGHCYTFIVDTVKQFIPNIKLLECKSADILLPWSKATPFCPWISIELKQNSPYVKKTSTEPPLAQSSKGTSHTPIYTAFSAPFPKNKSRRYNISVFFSPYTPSRITTSGISKSPQIRFLIVLWSLNYFTVHRPATTNSIHL